MTKKDSFTGRVREMIADQIADMVWEDDTAWTDGIRNASLCGPVNAWRESSGKDAAYHGANRFLLAARQAKDGYTSRRWVTFKQAIEMGGAVGKGEHGSPVFCYHPYVVDKKTGRIVKDGDPDNPKENEETRFSLTYSLVWNIDQTSVRCAKDINPMTPARGEAEKKARLATATFAAKYGVRLADSPDLHERYDSTSDTASVPPESAYDSREHYWQACFRTLALAALDGRRLGKGKTADDRKNRIAAEYAAALAMCSCGFTAGYENGAAHIREILGGKPEAPQASLLMSAFGSGDKAASLIMGDNA